MFPVVDMAMAVLVWFDLGCLGLIGFGLICGVWGVMM